MHLESILNSKRFLCSIDILIWKFWIQSFRAECVCSGVICANDRFCCFHSAKQMVLEAFDFCVIFTASFGSVFIVVCAPKCWFSGSEGGKKCNFEWKTTIRFACFCICCCSTKIDHMKTSKSIRCFSFKIGTIAVWFQFLNAVGAKMMQTDRRYQSKICNDRSKMQKKHTLYRFQSFTKRSTRTSSSNSDVCPNPTLICGRS